MMEIIQNIDWSPLWISLKTGFVATVAAFFTGILAARVVMRLGDKAKWIADGFLTLPLVLPPTVAGFLLLLLFSLRRPFGKFLMVNFDIKIVQTWPGCVIAAAVIAFPLMYRNARAAFEQVDINMIYAGRTLGLSESRILCRWRRRELLPELCWHLQERWESTEPLPCWRAIFWGRPEPFPWPSLRRRRLGITM